jgi:hypothetical protein
MVLPQIHLVIPHIHLLHHPRRHRCPLKKGQRDLWHAPQGVPAPSLDVDEDKEWLDTLQDEDVASKLLCELNQDLLGPPGDGVVIVISNSKEEGDDPAPATAIQQLSEGLEKATRGGGGEWEPIKIPHRNLAYIPKPSRNPSLLTRPRPPSYRQAIDLRNRARKCNESTYRC